MRSAKSTVMRPRLSFIETPTLVSRNSAKRFSSSNNPAVELAVKEGAPGKGKTDPGKGTGGTTGMKPAGLLELENLLAEFLDTKVGVSMNDKRGRITVDFADLIDLERIYRRMVEGIE